MKLVLAFILSFSFAASAENHTVVMKSISYDPKILEVAAGDSVDWSNKSYTEHSATDEGVFDTGQIMPGKTTKKIEFQKPGTYVYHCTMHGKSMSGQIVVRGK